MGSHIAALRSGLTVALMSVSWADLLALSSRSHSDAEGIGESVTLKGDQALSHWRRLALA